MHDRRDFQLFRSITRKLYEAGSNIPKNCVTAITISHLFRSEVYTSDPTVRILLPRFNRINIDVIYIFLKLEKDTFHLFQFFINRNSSSLFPISIAFYITSPYISKYIYDKSVKFILINLKMKYLKKKKFLWNVDSLYAQIYIYIYLYFRLPFQPSWQNTPDGWSVIHGSNVPPRVSSYIENVHEG